MKNPTRTRGSIRHALMGDEVAKTARAEETAKAARDAAIVAAVKAGLSLREVADLAGISHGTVANIAKKAGVEDA